MYDVLEELFKICLWEVVFEVVLSCRLVENSSLWGLLVFMYRFVILFIFGVWFRKFVVEIVFDGIIFKVIEFVCLEMFFLLYDEFIMFVFLVFKSCVFWFFIYNFIVFSFKNGCNVIFFFFEFLNKDFVLVMSVLLEWKDNGMFIEDLVWILWFLFYFVFVFNL